MAANYKNTTLIIVGHGSSKSPNQARPARKHAQYIRTLDIFAEVRTAFWKEDTFLKDALNDIKTDEIVIVPNLACSGHINQTVIPREMGLDGILTIRGSQHIHMCKPVGDFEGLPFLIASRLHDVMVERKLEAKDTTAFLVAHGNTNPDRPASHDTTLMMATKMYQQHPMHAILPAFIEEKPFLKGWDKRTNSANVIILPFMIAQGMHGARDIARLVGVEPSSIQSEQMQENGTPAGPFNVMGRNVWLMRAMGSHPKLADMIVEIAKDHLSKNSLHNF